MKNYNTSIHTVPFNNAEFRGWVAEANQYAVGKLCTNSTVDAPDIISPQNNSAEPQTFNVSFTPSGSFDSYNCEVKATDKGMYDVDDYSSIQTFASAIVSGAAKDETATASLTVPDEDLSAFNSGQSDLTVRCWNGSAQNSSMITLDNSPPTVDAFAIPDTSSSLTVPITTFTASDNVGVTGYMLTESDVAPNPGDSGWEGSRQTEYVFTTQGAKTLYAWAKDADGECFCQPQ